MGVAAPIMVASCPRSSFSSSTISRLLLLVNRPWAPHWVPFDCGARRLHLRNEPRSHSVVPSS